MTFLGLVGMLAAILSMVGYLAGKRIGISPFWLAFLPVGLMFIFGVGQACGFSLHIATPPMYVMAGVGWHRLQLWPLSSSLSCVEISSEC